ncbi:metal-sensing transcriptional repressor [[Clostridium] fimetarium]
MQILQADKAKVNRLLKTARGQIDGILKMIEEDRYCIDISNQLMATQAILNKANKEVISAHMKTCVKEAITQNKCDEKIDELIAVIDKLSK